MNNLSSQPYWRRARLAGLILQMAPFVRMIGLNGSLARGEANENSDIDFLIITKTGRIWTARALSTLLMAILGLKRYPNKISGRVCLNLYHAENHLQLSCRDHPAAPIWLARNYAYTLPLWQKNNIFRRFIQDNQWVKSFDEEFYYQDYQPNIFDKIIAAILGFLRWLGEFIFDLIFNDWGENILKSYQTQRILRDPRTKKSPPGAIYLSDQELRFHPRKT